jgi:hypothetical protein
MIAQPLDPVALAKKINASLSGSTRAVFQRCPMSKEPPDCARYPLPGYGTGS